MSIELLTIKELLRDPTYRKFFSKVPKLPEHYKPSNLPWKLIILKHDERVWRSKRFGTYQEAFAGLKKMLPTIDNAAINCPPLAFMPPIRTVRLKGKFTTTSKGKQIPVVKSIIWTPQVPGDLEPHSWCGHCRRPSIFRFATITPRMKEGFYAPPGEPAVRCIICGASERILDLRHPENAQKWDPNRPVVY